MLSATSPAESAAELVTGPALAEVRPAAQAARRPLGRMPRRRAFILLRFTLIVAAAYVLISQVGVTEVSPVLAGLIGVALLSNLVLLWIPRRLFHSNAFAMLVVCADTVGVTAAMLYSGLTADFFYVYFIVLFVAAIGENLAVITLGALVAAAGYVVTVSMSGDPSQLWSTSTLLRLPFLLVVATFYGYLTEQTRRQRARAREECEAARRSEALREDVTRHAEELERNSAALTREVAERRRTEQELALANRKLRSASQIKSDFISTVSHELRTPVTSIRNSLDILKSGRAGELHGEQERFVRIAGRNARRLAEIINDVLDLSKVEAGKLSFTFDTVDVRPLLETLVDGLQAQAEEASLTLALECEDGLPKVRADLARIEQVLTNLLSNALKFTAEGGSVRLSARAVAGGVELAVRDTGVGLSTEQQDRVFDRFYQVEDPLTRSVGGSGLGLSISKRLVALHAAELLVESEPGRGSRFYFVLRRPSPQTDEICAFEEIFQAYRQEACFFSLLLISLDANLEKQRVPEALGRLAELVEKGLPRSADRLVVQPSFGRLVLTLLSTSRDGAGVVRRRLERSIAEAGERGETPRATLHGPALFPDDGASGVRLIDRAQRIGAR